MKFLVLIFDGVKREVRENVISRLRVFQFEKLVECIKGEEVDKRASWGIAR